MKRDTISVVIVVYNKQLGETSTCLKLKGLADDVVVVDNSTANNQNNIFCKEHHIQYIPMDGNKGLSKAYNVAIDHLKDSDVVVLLDDDTEVPELYFTKLKAALIEKPDIDIFVPIIRGQDDVVYSPNNYRFIRNELVRDPTNEIRQDRFNAISSCMAIRMRVFDGYRYNEKLFVDEVDHCFCREQREKGRRFAVLNVEIQQNFHQRAIQITPEAALKRVKIRITDIFRYARLMGSGKYIIQAFVKGCGLAIQIGRRSKSIKVVIEAVLLSCKLMFVEI